MSFPLKEDEFLPVIENLGMSVAERTYLADMSEVVDLWRAYSASSECFYLSAESGMDGMRAFAFSGLGRLEHIAVPKERILAVDLGRNTVELEGGLK